MKKSGLYNIIGILIILVCISYIIAENNNTSNNETSDNNSSVNNTTNNDTNEDNNTEVSDNNTTVDDEPNYGYGQNKTRTRNQTENKSSQGIGQDLSQMIRERKGELKAGNYTGALGQALQVREMVRGLKELRVNNISVETELNITQETGDDNTTRLKVKLRKGMEKEIKVLPDSAMQISMEKVKLSECNEENNCTMKLIELVDGQDVKVVYKFNAMKEKKFLWIFKYKSKVKTNVDAETSEII
jgi:hypothetical protein